METWEKNLLAYRKEKFAVEIVNCAHPADVGEINLSVTHNGRQWQSMSLLPYEVEAVIAALKKVSGK